MTPEEEAAEKKRKAQEAIRSLVARTVPGMGSRTTPAPNTPSHFPPLHFPLPEGVTPEQARGAVSPFNPPGRQSSTQHPSLGTVLRGPKDQSSNYHPTLSEALRGRVNPPKPPKDPSDYPGAFDGDLGRLLTEGFLGNTDSTQVDQGSGIMDQINSLLNQDYSTPDRWVSPYSQVDLNNIGTGFDQASADRSAEYLQGVDEINALYGAGRDRRTTDRQGFVDELAGNAANIGVGYKEGSDAKQLGADAAFLDEQSYQNQATDVAHNQKMAKTIGGTLAQLGQMARAGLLTQKQFVPGSNSMPDNIKAQLGLLQDQQGREWDLEDQAREALLGSIPETEFEQDELQMNPELQAAMGSFQQSNPEAYELFQSYYNKSGGNVLDTQAAIEEAMTQTRNKPTLPTLSNPFKMGDFVKSLGQYIGKTPAYQAEQSNLAMLPQVRDWLQQFNPGYGGINTRNKITTTSQT